MESAMSTESPMRNRVARILVVEDERDVRETIKLQLEDEGHEVTETDSGKHALALAESSPFDLVLTDVMLPDLNGIELVQQVDEFVRQVGGKPSMPGFYG